MILFIPKQEIAVVIDSSELAVSLRKLFEGLTMISTNVDANKTLQDLLPGSEN